VRGISALLLGTGLAACTGSAPPEPPIELPPGEVLDNLAHRAPVARVVPPLILDAKSCTFARYVARARNGRDTFVLIHPLRSRCELWLGLSLGIGDLEYCRFPREDLIPVGMDPFTGGFQIDDLEHCVFASDAPPPENANARAATQAFTSNQDQLD
jgi:hypothetical protein